jgi:hypothetical protein
MPLLVQTCPPSARRNARGQRQLGGRVGGVEGRRQCARRHAGPHRFTSRVCIWKRRFRNRWQGLACRSPSQYALWRPAATHHDVCAMPQGGVFGAVATSEELLAALVPPVRQLLARGEGAASAPAGFVAVVKAEPGDYTLPMQQAALIMVDFQKDVIHEGGYAHRLGHPVARLQVRVERIVRALTWRLVRGSFGCRALGSFSNQHPSSICRAPVEELSSVHQASAR